MFKILVIFFVLLTQISFAQEKEFPTKHKFDIEGGILRPHKNMIGDDKFGDRINFLAIQNKTSPYYRLSYYYQMDEKNSFRVLYAPLSIGGNGAMQNDATYQNNQFNGGQDASYQYTFNSYRLTYARTLFQDDKLTFKFGITGKIRNASVKLTQGDTQSYESSLGFVPLLYYHLTYRFSPKIFFTSEADFAYSKMGRATDISFALNYDINRNFDIGAGYRMLEGGAINNKVYTMALINYGFVRLGMKI